jgi:hypothetical protein
VNKEHRNDISIGSDQWIEWIDISGKQDNAVEIDSIILTMADLWNNLETQCVAGCCGIDAFDFRPEEVRKAGTEFDIETLRKQAQDIEAEVQSLDSEVLVSTRLNNYFHRDVFIKLLQHLVLCFDDKIPD